jgi:hypothetical protein
MIVCACPGDEEQSNYDLRSQLRLGKETKEEEKDIVGAERGIRESFTSCGIFRLQRREVSEPRFLSPYFPRLCRPFAWSYSVFFVFVSLKSHSKVRLFFSDHLNSHDCSDGSELLGLYHAIPGDGHPSCRITNGGCGR